MQEIIQPIMDKVTKKAVQSNCKKILKKCSFKSSKDIGNITELVIWLYVYDYYDEAIKVCDMIEDIEFTGNYTLWDNIDHALCVKARILRERGKTAESAAIIKYINQYRAPHLYKNIKDWFLHTLDKNIENSIRDNCKSGAKGWRLIKLENAIAYREAGKFPVSDRKLEKIISDMKDILKEEK